jgi:hypothetical protein
MKFILKSSSKKTESNPNLAPAKLAREADLDFTASSWFASPGSDKTWRDSREPNHLQRVAVIGLNCDF